jgi:small subunit ribosomal protein S18
VVRLPALLPESAARTNCPLPDASGILGVLDSIKAPTDGSQRAQKLSEFARTMLPGREETSRNMLEQAERDNYSRQVFRRWQPGDVYAPKDLSGPEQKKWKNARRTAGSDAFDTLGINPINEYKVRSL